MLRVVNIVGTRPNLVNLAEPTAQCALAGRDRSAASRRWPR